MGFPSGTPPSIPAPEFPDRENRPPRATSGGAPPSGALAGA